MTTRSGMDNQGAGDWKSIGASPADLALITMMKVDDALDSPGGAEQPSEDCLLQRAQHIAADAMNEVGVKTTIRVFLEPLLCSMLFMYMTDVCSLRSK